MTNHIVLRPCLVKVDLATERECQLTTRKRAERTKRYLLFRFAIGQASCLIRERRPQLTFSFCCPRWLQCSLRADVCYFFCCVRSFFRVQ